MQVPWTGQLRRHSQAAQQQLRIINSSVPVNRHGQATLTPARAPGRAAAGSFSCWPTLG